MERSCGSLCKVGDGKWKTWCCYQFRKTNVTRREGLPTLQSMTDAILYELHIRDATIHPNSGVIQREHIKD